MWKYHIWETCNVFSKETVTSTCHTKVSIKITVVGIIQHKKIKVCANIVQQFWIRPINNGCSVGGERCGQNIWWPTYNYIILIVLLFVNQNDVAMEWPAHHLGWPWPPRSPHRSTPFLQFTIGPYHDKWSDPKQNYITRPTINKSTI